MRDRLVAAVLTAVLMAACSEDAVSTTPPTSPPKATDVTEPMTAFVDVGGYELFIACRGTGSPTVIYEAGASGDNGWFSTVDAEVYSTTKTCGYDRAGIGLSDARPVSLSPVSAGDVADELDRLLAGAAIDGPLVLVGHSFGGMVEQLFADRHPDQVVGLVFDDSSMAGQLVGPDNVVWEDGPGNRIDMRASKKELLAAGSYGDTPMVVLTQNFTDTNEIPPRWQRKWRVLHAELAARSIDSIHVIAVDSGHMIQEDEPDLVIAAIEEVLAAARTGRPLTPCDDRFTHVGGECAV